MPGNILSTVKDFSFPGYPLIFSDHEPMRLELELVPKENGLQQTAFVKKTTEKIASSLMG